MMAVTRRYEFRLYPTADQAEVLHRHRRMIADLWNALLQRREDIRRRTVQRQVWFDAEGQRHVGESVHCLTYVSERCRDGDVSVVEPGENGRPKPFTAYDMQNEVTWLFNSLPEWREMSIWCGHRTARLLDRAFKAFYKRAKRGDGASAGYPRFKRRDRHGGIPHSCTSGCALVKDDRHERSWRLRLKGVPGAIHARGMVPAKVVKWTDADVMWRNGKWSVSIACEIEGRREPGYRRTDVALDPLDGFAVVNGIVQGAPDGVIAAKLIEDDIDALKAERDRRWPRGRRVPDMERADLNEIKAQISALSAKAARVRRNALHVWTARIVREARDLTVTAPKVRENTRTPRGDAKRWGANVETVSAVNRNTLQDAPATVEQMLRYKAEEAGIRCDIVEDAAPNIAVGGELVAVGRQLRRARREQRKAA